MPSASPPDARRSCRALEARRVVAQVRTGLAYEPDRVSPHALAAGAADWLDPHGLWSAAPDSPIEGRIEKRSVDLVAEMESRIGDDCPAARDVGGALGKWVAELRGRFDHARATTTDADAAAASEEIPFDAIAYSRPARSFAEELGERVGAFERAYGASAKPYADAARDRFFPELDADDLGSRAPRRRRARVRAARRSARRVGPARRGGERLRGGPRESSTAAPLGEVGAHRGRGRPGGRGPGAARWKAISSCRSPDSRPRASPSSSSISSATRRPTSPSRRRRFSSGAAMPRRAP